MKRTGSKPLTTRGDITTTSRQPNKQVPNRINLKRQIRRTFNRFGMRNKARLGTKTNAIRMRMKIRMRQLDMKNKTAIKT